MRGNKYQDYPNLLLVAKELTRCKHPNKILNAMQSLLEGSVKDSANSGEDFGLTGSDILSFSDQPY